MENIAPVIVHAGIQLSEKLKAIIEVLVTTRDKAQSIRIAVSWNILTDNQDIKKESSVGRG